MRMLSSLAVVGLVSGLVPTGWSFAQDGRLAAGPAEESRQNLLDNGRFEGDTAGWNTLWTRGSSAGKSEIDRAVSHSGQASIRIEHRGETGLEPGGEHGGSTSPRARPTSSRAGSR